MKILRRT